ncbi:MAG: glycosyltransferase family 2 protein [Eubacteriales bacterium]|nr:glycosyltransferase family 2 protein [Eubacteriales bacterium]
MDRICVIVPCYNEQEVLPMFLEAADRIAKKMHGAELTYLFVDDGSSDGTLALLRQFAAQREDVRYLSFSRNFGKEAAMLAGLEHAQGEFVAVMDADLQDPPELLLKMYETLKADPTADVAAARRETREGEPPVRSFFARLFYKLINKMSKTEIVDGARDFRLMRRRVVRAILSMPERNRFSKGIFGWVGFKTVWMSYRNVERAAGTTKWSFWKLFLYSIDGILAFSTAPLSMVSLLGLAMCLIAVASIVFVIVRQLLFGGSAFGWPSLVCIILFVSGIQLLCLGIIGQYLAKTYTEVKARPNYVLRETEKGEV